MLRAHMHQCLFEVAKIADVVIPKIADNMHYDEDWQLEAYESPKLIDNESAKQG